MGETTPTPPAPQEQAPVPAPAGSGSSGLSPNVAAGLACLFGFVSGILFLVLEKKNQYVRFYAMQSTIFSFATIAFSIAVSILVHVPVLGFAFAILSMVVNLGIFVIWVIQLIKAFSGTEWEIPYLGALARKQLQTSPI